MKGYILMEIIYLNQLDVFRASTKKMANLIFVDVLIGIITIPLLYDTGQQ